MGPGPSAALSSDSMATILDLFPFLGYNVLVAQIPCLTEDGSNWATFATHFWEAMEAAHYWGYYDSTTACPTPIVVNKLTDNEKKAIAAWDRKDTVASAHLIWCLPDLTALEVSEFNTAVEC
jgi:hypothetical protein